MNLKTLPDTSPAGTANICKNCSNEFEGKFCNQCGEKVIHEHERSILHFLEGVFHVITHIDSKILRNLKLIILRPGFISKNLAEGIRRPFMKPIPMFFVANLIYFLFPVFETFNTSFNSQIRYQQYSVAIRPMVEKKMKEKNITYEQLEQKYNAKTSTFSKLMLILFVPMFAVVFAIVNFRRDRYFADHLLIALEFMSYMLFYNTILWSFIEVGAVRVSGWMGFDLGFLFGDEMTFSVPVIFLSSYYFLVRAERTFYEQKWWRAFLKAFLMLGIMPFIVLTYRFILFQVTMIAM